MSLEMTHYLQVGCAQRSRFLVHDGRALL